MVLDFQIKNIKTLEKQGNIERFRDELARIVAKHSLKSFF